MKNYPIFRRIFDYEKKFYLNHQDTLVDYVFLILTIAQKVLDESSAIETPNIEKVSDPYLYLRVNKGARVFIYIAYNKYVSLSFPFNVKKEGNTVKLYINKINTEIGNEIISECISIIKQMQNDSLFIDVWMESDDPYSEISLRIIDYLLHTEPCYLRYDYDSDNANGFIHPLNHFDINMSKIGHIKLGLYNKLTFKQFLDILNPETNCYYLSSPMMHYNNKNMTLKNKRKRIRR